MIQIIAAVIFGAMSLVSTSYCQTPVETFHNEKFVMKKLQEIIEDKAQENSKTRTQITIGIKQDDSRASVLVSHVLGTITALVVILKLDILKRPQGLWNFILEVGKLFLGTAIGGAMLSWIYHPIVEFFVKTGRYLIEDEETLDQPINSSVLIEFVRNWQELKQYTPEVLHEQIDDLYLQYVQQRANLNFDEQEATLLINKIFVECMKEHTEKMENVALSVD